MEQYANENFGLRLNNNSEFILDSFQIEAIESLNNGNSVLVSAPTSSGKTLIAEHAIREGLKNGQSVYYTAPIKALCNQKFRDFSNLFGIRNIGLLTGDNSIRTDAQVLVMTTEVLRNMLYSSNGVPQNLSFVILDEVHFLEDPYRGAVWEEIVLNLPKNVLLVALSATVSNAKELGDWITSVRGRTTVIERATRPVPLKGHYLVADRQGRFKTIRLPILIDGKENPKGRNFTNLSIRKKGQRGRRWSPPRRLEVLEELKRSQMLPAIHFIFSRKGCDEARNSFLRTGLNLNTKPTEKEPARTLFLVIEKSI